MAYPLFKQFFDNTSEALSAIVSLWVMWGMRFAMLHNK